MLLRRLPGGEVKRLSTSLLLPILIHAIQRNPPILEALSRCEQVVVVIVAVTPTTAISLTRSLAGRSSPNLSSATLLTHTYANRVSHTTHCGPPIQITAGLPYKSLRTRMAMASVPSLRRRAENGSGIRHPLLLAAMCVWEAGSDLYGRLAVICMGGWQ